MASKKQKAHLKEILTQEKQNQSQNNLPLFICFYRLAIDSAVLSDCSVMKIEKAYNNKGKIKEFINTIEAMQDKASLKLAFFI